MSKGVTFGQLLAVLRERGDGVQADRMLIEVTQIVTHTLNKSGLGSILSNFSVVQNELYNTPMDDIIQLVAMYKTVNPVNLVKSVNTVNPAKVVRCVQSVGDRVAELRRRGWVVTIGGSF